MRRSGMDRNAPPLCHCNPHGEEQRGYCRDRGALLTVGLVVVLLICWYPMWVYVYVGVWLGTENATGAVRGQVPTPGYLRP